MRRSHRPLAGRAVAAGVVLLPGIGFDVVPADCLAMAVCAAWPGSSALDPAFLADTGPSGGRSADGDRDADHAEPVRP